VPAANAAAIVKILNFAGIATSAKQESATEVSTPSHAIAFRAHRFVGTYWHLAGKLSVAKSAVRGAIAQLRRGLSLLEGISESRECNQIELDVLVTLTSAPDRRQRLCGS
jgi:hypothetical protein